MLYEAHRWQQQEKKTVLKNIWLEIHCILKDSQAELRSCHSGVGRILDHSTFFLNRGMDSTYNGGNIRTKGALTEWKSPMCLAILLASGAPVIAAEITQNQTSSKKGECFKLIIIDQGPIVIIIIVHASERSSKLQRDHVCLRGWKKGRRHSAHVAVFTISGVWSHLSPNSHSPFRVTEVST